MIKAVSFDCAQTLLEVRWDAHIIAIESARMTGLDLPEEAASDYFKLFGSRYHDWAKACSRHHPELSSQVFWRTLAGDWLTQYGKQDHLDAVIDASNEIFFGPEGTVFLPFPGAAEAVADVKRQGMKLIVLSNWDDSLEKALKHCGLHEPFDYIYASLVEGAEKPDPDFFALAQKDLGLQPDEILHIGDNPLDDAIGALNAGWHPVLIRSDLAAGPWVLDEKGQGQLAKAKVDASPWIKEDAWPPCPVMDSFAELSAQIARLNS
jgi:FMN phosphatase YigB (HAD superfamily)